MDQILCFQTIVLFILSSQLCEIQSGLESVALGLVPLTCGSTGDITTTDEEALIVRHYLFRHYPLIVQNAIANKTGKKTATILLNIL